MVRSLVIFGFLASLSCVVVAESIEHVILRREAAITAAAIRNITIKDHQSRVQVASMATDFMVALNYATYTLNNVIPNMIEDENYKLIAGTALQINTIVNSIEQALTGDAEKLKELIAVTLENVGEEVNQFEQKYKENSNHFLNTQRTRKQEFLIFELYKLKFQAQFFEKTNKELMPEMLASITTLDDAIKSIASNDITIEVELRHLMQHISIITARGVTKLENWVEVNSNRTDDVKIAEDVAKTLTELYPLEYLAISGKHDAQHLKKELISLYTAGETKVSELGNINYLDSLGGQEFIRSCMFDGLTLGRAYAENVKLLLLKA